MKGRSLAAMLAFAALGGGCVTQPAAPPPAPPEPPVVEAPPAEEPVPEPEPKIVIATVPVPAESDALKAIQYFSQLKQRTPREQRVEQERLRKSFAGSRSDADRVRLALALSIPGSSPKEEAQALELLEPLARDPGNDYHDLAALLTALLGEQRRRGEQAQQLQNKLEGIKQLEKEMSERSNVREGRAR